MKVEVQKMAVNDIIIYVVTRGNKQLSFTEEEMLELHVKTQEVLGVIPPEPQYTCQDGECWGVADFNDVDAEECCPTDEEMSAVLDAYV
jgi:hypothetical protein